MNATTIYKIQVHGSSTTAIFESHFLQFPTTAELLASLDDAASELRDRGNAASHSGDMLDAESMYDTADGFNKLIEVVRVADLPVPPIAGMNQVVVNFAGVKVGRITAETLPARTRTPLAAAALAAA